MALPKACEHAAIGKPVVTGPGEAGPPVQPGHPGPDRRVARFGRRRAVWHRVAGKQPAAHDGKQFLHLDRLGHEIIHAGGQAILPILRQHAGGHGHHGQIRPVFHAANVLGGFQTIHDWHLDIHEHQVEGLFMESGQSFFAILRHDHRGAAFLEQLARHFPIDGIVLDQQQATPSQVGISGTLDARPRSTPVGLPGSTLVSGLFQGRGKAEHTARGRQAFHPDMSLHQIHQTAADGQSQTGAAKAAGGGAVGLLERLEEAGLLLRTQADACIPHFEFQDGDLLVLPDPMNGYHHLTGLGELDGIAYQIDEDLAQAQGIAQQLVGHIGIDAEPECQLLGSGLGPQKPVQIAQHVRETEFEPLQIELARFDLGEIEDVVDDAQQGAGRTVDPLEIVTLAVVQVRVQNQVRHADDGVHGGADLVAHVGQEGALRLVGSFRPLFGAPPFGDVEEHTQHAGGRAIGQLKGGDRIDHATDIAVGIHDVDFPLGSSPAGDDGLVFGLEGLAFGQGNVVQVQNPAADKVLPAHREGPLVSLVAGGEAGIHAFHENGIGKRVEQGGKDGGTRRHPAFQLLVQGLQFLGAACEFRLPARQALGHEVEGPAQAVNLPGATHPHPGTQIARRQGRRRRGQFLHRLAEAAGQQRGEQDRQNDAGQDNARQLRRQLGGPGRKLVKGGVGGHPEPQIAEFHGLEIGHPLHAPMPQTQSPPCLAASRLPGRIGRGQDRSGQLPRRAQKALPGLIGRPSRDFMGKADHPATGIQHRHRSGLPHHQFARRFGQGFQQEIHGDDVAPTVSSPPGHGQGYPRLAARDEHIGLGPVGMAIGQGYGALVPGALAGIVIQRLPAWGRRAPGVVPVQEARHAGERQGIGQSVRPATVRLAQKQKRAARLIPHDEGRDARIGGEHRPELAIEGADLGIRVPAQRLITGHGVARGIQEPGLAGKVLAQLQHQGEARLPQAGTGMVVQIGAHQQVVGRAGEQDKAQQAQNQHAAQQRAADGQPAFQPVE